MSKEELVKKLQKISHNIRCSIIDMTYKAGCGHTGGSLSMVEIGVVLYFYAMNVDPKRPDWSERDRYVQSKGHATPCYYSILTERGYFPKDWLFTEYGVVDGKLQGHPCRHTTPGVDMSTGSLGQGLSVGIGMALGGERNGQSFYTYVLLGDGEMQEGQIWEAVMYAGVHQVKRLISIIDYNKVQLTGKTEETLSLEPLNEKLKSFRWQWIECDGHSIMELMNAVDEAKVKARLGPVAIIAHTVKGKGISFMEGKWQWHGRACNDEDYKIAKKELENQVTEVIS